MGFPSCFFLPGSDKSFKQAGHVIVKKTIDIFLNMAPSLQHKEGRRSKKLREWPRGTTLTGCPLRGRLTYRRQDGTSRRWPSKKLVSALEHTHRENQVLEAASRALASFRD